MKHVNLLDFTVKQTIQSLGPRSPRVHCWVCEGREGRLSHILFWVKYFNKNTEKSREINEIKMARFVSKVRCLNIN